MLCTRCTRCPHRLFPPPLFSRLSTLRTFATTLPPRSAYLSPVTTDPAPEATSPPSKSSVCAGQHLKGLGYLKGQELLLAWEDHEYPDWLWGLLEERPKGDGEEGGGDGDEFCEFFGFFSSFWSEILGR